MMTLSLDYMDIALLIISILTLLNVLVITGTLIIVFKVLLDKAKQKKKDVDKHHKYITK